MTRYSESDFERAQFARLMSGEIAARIDPDSESPWHNSGGGKMPDARMAEAGWIPVKKSTTAPYRELWHASLDREAKTERELIRVAELAAQAKDRADRAEAELGPLQASHHRLHERERATAIRLAATITERNTEQHRAEVAEVKARGWRKRAEQWAEALDQAEDSLSKAREDLVAMQRESRA